MALWPFTKRRKKSSTPGKRPAVEETVVQQKNAPETKGSVLYRRITHQRDDVTQGATYSASASGSPLPEQIPTDSPDSLMQRPHKRSSIIRKLSRRRDKSQSPSLHNAQLDRSKVKPGNNPPGHEHDRRLSYVSTVQRNSMDSQISSRAFKIGPLDVFTPRPTLRCDAGSLSSFSQSRDIGKPQLVPTRTNSHSTDHWRYKGGFVSEEHLANSRGRVDDLADELDSKGLREAMERDRRRRQRKKQESEERLRLKLEKAAFSIDHESITGPEIGIDAETEAEKTQAQDHHCCRQPFPDTEAGGSSQYAERGSHVTGTQTPLSWFNDNPSSENVNPGLPQFAPRPEVVTPVSMDSREERPEKDSGHVVPDISWESRNMKQPDDSVVLQTKTSAWTSFIKRATAARIKREHASRTVPLGSPAPAFDSENRGYTNRKDEAPPGEYLEVDNLRHRAGQTPGRHISNEVALAMNAIQTGHIQEKEYEDEMRDSVLPAPLAPYLHSNDSHASSRSSLGHHNLGLRGGGKNMDDHRESPVLPSQILRSSSQQSHHYSRPSSTQRYSPPIHRLSGAASWDNGRRPTSAMSTSLASIDSEGSWLSGKINPRQSIQQISSLRTSASSLRKHYQEMDGENNMDEDEYFSTVDKGQKEHSADDDESGEARLDLEESDEEGSVISESERTMWREGMQKRVIIQDQPDYARTMSNKGLLNDLGDDRQSINEESGGPMTIPLDSEIYSTQVEQPFDPFARINPTSSEFKTSLDNPSRQMQFFG